MTLLWRSHEYSRERLLKFPGVGLHQTLVALTLVRLKSCDSETDTSKVKQEELTVIPSAKLEVHWWVSQGILFKVGATV